MYLGSHDINKPMRFSLVYLLLAAYATIPSVTSQRSLLHLKHDLEYRLSSYLGKRQILDELLATSIYNDPTRSTTGSNVRFTNLVIHNGALVLNPQIANPSLKIMENKTHAYASLKMNELFQIKTQFESIKRRLDEPTQQFIYKGAQNSLAARRNISRISGTRIFKQFLYGHLFESNQIDLETINQTNVDKVLNDTYLDLPQFRVRDYQSRLFFEGRKTFWRSIFETELRSGCCDRMKPLHTNRMMLRSKYQEIRAPVMFHTNDMHNREPVVITNLLTPQIFNQHLAVGLISNRPDDIGLVQSMPENLIQFSNIISILPTFPPQPEIAKILSFREMLAVDEVQIMTYKDSRLMFSLAHAPQILFDLSHDNRLLRHALLKNETTMTQLIAGAMVLNCESHFLAGLDSEVTNRIARIDKFFTQALVRIDKPQIIWGFIHFYALPSVFQPDGLSATVTRSIPIIGVDRRLDINLVNGMSFPLDTLVLPLTAGKDILIRGHRQYSTSVVSKDHLQVKQQVNGMLMPAEIIPLHLNDFISDIGFSNLVFIDGIVANHITIETGHFDDIILRNVQGDAKHLLMNSIITSRSDGSHAIRAPIHVANLILSADGSNQGLLNGFRPHDVLELNPKEISIFLGRKKFLANVEVVDCVITDINNLPSWTNHLVRIDRSGTIQTVKNRLAFIRSHATNIDKSSRNRIPDQRSSIHVSRFNVEFSQHENIHHYQNNLLLSPEFYSIHLALMRSLANYTNGRYRVLDQVRLLNPDRNRINGIVLEDIVTLNTPSKFADRFVLVGKITMFGDLQTNRVVSNYPIDVMDIVQFYNYRIPILGSQIPIHLNNLILSSNNRASFVQSRLLNGISLNQFANSIMSLTRQQIIDNNLIFTSPINLDGVVRSESSLNGVNNFRQLTNILKTATFSFENGLQCNIVIIKN